MAKLTEKQIKEGWKIVRFDEIARNLAERVDPNSTDLKVYVGLEHLDPGSLRITRFGTPDDVKGEKLRVKPGQIIFGKRRAYQKKVAVADFDGICSAHAMVLEAIPGKILSELLPFFMQSDMFMDRAVAISEGSLSPTIKWKTLARQEFPLPPLPRQKEILEVLGAAEKSLHFNGLRSKKLEELKKIFANKLLLNNLSFNQLFRAPTIDLPKGWKRIPLDEILGKIQYGLSEAIEKRGEYPILRMMNIDRGYVVSNDLKFIDLKSEVADRYKLKKGDILFNRTNSIDWVGRTGLFLLEGDYVFASYLLRLEVDKEKISPFYLNQYLNLPMIQYRLKAYATPGVSQANINPESLRQLPFLLPPKSHMEKCDFLLNSLDDLLAESIKKYHLHERLTHNLRNCLFTD